MIGDYRVRIPGGHMPSVTASGQVNFDVFVEVETAEGWAQIEGGHFTQQVPGEALEACANANQAKALIGDLVLARGLTLSDRALRAVIALLPGGVWPSQDVVIDLD